MVGITWPLLKKAIQVIHDEPGSAAVCWCTLGLGTTAICTAQTENWQSTVQEIQECSSWGPSKVQCMQSRLPGEQHLQGLGGMLGNRKTGHSSLRSLCGQTKLCKSPYRYFSQRKQFSSGVVWHQEFDKLLSWAWCRVVAKWTVHGT